MKSVSIKIRKDGTIEIDFQGFTGSTCEIEFEKLKQLLESLGIKADLKERQLKPEYYVTTTETTYVTSW